MKKILLFGAAGQLGSALLKAFPKEAEVTALTRHSENFCGNLENLSGIRDTVLRISPDVIYNAAAYTDVDRAESEPERAFLVNGKAVQAMAAAAAETGSLLVHFSTDYVFDGRSAGSYSENDEPHPLNRYGESKLAGDLEILNADLTSSLILRAGWLYSADHRSFFTAILGKALRGEKISVVTGETGTPVSASFLADAAVRLSLFRPVKRKAFFNAVPEGAATRFEFARFILKTAESLGLPLLTKADDIAPLEQLNPPRPAVRPAHAVLDCRKLRSELSGIQSWQCYAEAEIRKFAETHLK